MNKKTNFGIQFDNKTELLNCIKNNVRLDFSSISVSNLYIRGRDKEIRQLTDFINKLPDDISLPILDLSTLGNMCIWRDTIIYIRIETWYDDIYKLYIRNNMLINDQSSNTYSLDEIITKLNELKVQYKVLQKE